MDKLILKTLKASLANNKDRYTVTMIADAASVGVTDPLFGSGKRINWTAAALEKLAPSLKGKPVNMQIAEDGKLQPHTKTAVGIVDEAYFDKAQNRMVATSSLWRHYFPESLEQLAKLHASGEAQVSIEVDADEFTEDGDVITLTDGSFAGLGIVADGADRGNSIRLLASAMEREEEAAKRRDSISLAVPGSFEWIGDHAAHHLTAAANSDTYVPVEVVATYPDRLIYRDSDKLYQLPYTVSGTQIKFNDTIEVEQDFKPLSAASAVPTNVPTKEESGKTMAEIDDKELAELRAKAERAATAETEIATLKASQKTKEEEDELATLRQFKADQEKKDKETSEATLAASRMEEIEKTYKYEDKDERAAALEAFKTMPEDTFKVVSKTLTAAAAAKAPATPGGVATEGRIRPNTLTASREDADGQAAAILNDPGFAELIKAVSDQKETK